MMKKDLSNVRAVIFDWAGTTVDYGSLAPTRVFLEIFRRRGVEITVEEARGPMGRAKHEHIAMVAALPRVIDLWHSVHGAPPNHADVLAMYHDFLPLQKDILTHGSKVIPGVPEAIAMLRQQGMKIGSTTGYTRELMEVVIPIAASQGYSPDATVCSDEVVEGRPAPWMNLKAAELLGGIPAEQILVADDTLVGIEAGKNAGMLTLGVTQSGNLLGLTESEVQAMPDQMRQRRLHEIADQFLAAGADFVLPSVADLPHLLYSATC